MAAASIAVRFTPVGRLLDQTFVYWRGTPIEREPFQAYVPHSVEGWTPTSMPGHFNDSTMPLNA